MRSVAIARASSSTTSSREHELVVAATGAHHQAQAVLDAVWEYLEVQSDADDGEDLSLGMVSGTPGRSASARIVAADDAPLPDGTPVTVDPTTNGWTVRLGPLTVDVGHGEWRESTPLGRPVVAAGAWQGDTYVADLYVITTPHRVRLTVAAGTATATWNILPLTTPDLVLHLTNPLMTHPDVS
ncbi:hypothetical protein ACXJJ3_21005 [Kribbella sp. WER1]